MDPQTVNQQPQIQHSFENPMTLERRVNWLKVGLIVLGAFAFLGAGVYLGARMIRSNQTKFEDSMTVKPTPTEYVVPTAIVEPTREAARIISPINKSLIDNFQSYLTSKCNKNLFNEHFNFYYKSMALEDIPILYDSDLIKIDPSKIRCESYDGQFKGDSYLEIDGENSLLLYDNYSNITRPVKPKKDDIGLLIKERDGIKYGLDFFYADGPQFTDTFGIMLLVEKKFRLPNNAIVTIVLSKSIMDINDSRITELLKDYSDEPTPGFFEGKRLLNSSGYEKEIYRRFFSNVSNLQSPEKERIEEAERIMNSIKLK